LLAGLTLATLSLFPLLNALTTANGYWLHWRTQDTVETLLSWLLCGAVIGVSLAIPHAKHWPRVSEAIHAVWLAVAAFLLFGGVVRLGVLGTYASQHRSAAPLIVAAIGLTIVLLSAKVVHGAREGGGGFFMRVTLVMSPLALVFLFNLGKAQWNHLEPALPGPVAVGSEGAAGRPLNVVLLFDELSADYLYGERAVDLAAFPALQKLLATSKVYAAARLPGGGTEIAIPSLFSSQKVAPGAVVAMRSTPADGFLGQALTRHMDTRVFGWHIDYCSGIAAQAHSCRAVSVYNARTLGDGFSLVHPWWTNLNLLPSEFPFGLAKVEAAVRMHAATYELARTWVREQIADGAVDLVYVHVNMPHMPFISPRFAGAQRSRFLMTSRSYEQQLHYVDEFVETVNEALDRYVGTSRPVNLVAMSDHNARWLMPRSEHEHVVFVWRRTGEFAGGTDTREQWAYDLLARVLNPPLPGESPRSATGTAAR
jgi:hypothetical protein